MNLPDSELRKGAEADPRHDLARAEQEHIAREANPGWWQRFVARFRRKASN